MAQPAHQNGAKPEVKVSAAEVEAAVEAAAKAAKLPTAEVIGKQPMTQIFQVGRLHVLQKCFSGTIMAHC